MVVLERLAFSYERGTPVQFVRVGLASGGYMDPAVGHPSGHRDKELVKAVGQSSFSS